MLIGSSLNKFKFYLLIVALLFYLLCTSKTCWGVIQPCHALVSVKRYSMSLAYPSPDKTKIIIGDIRTLGFILILTMIHSVCSSGVIVVLIMTVHND